MNIRRYVADDMAQAMERIRDELGRDAFILNSRKVRRKGFMGFFRKPQVEVMAAYEPASPAPVFRSSGGETAVGAGGHAAFPAGDGGYGPGGVVLAPPPVRAGAEFADRGVSLLNQTVSAPAPGMGEQSAPRARTLFAPGAEPAARARTLYTPGTDASGGFKTYVPRDITAQVRPPETDAESGGVSQKIGALEEKIESLTGTVSLLVGKMGRKGTEAGGYAPDIELFLSTLMENEVHEEFAHKIAREVAEIVSRQKGETEDVCESLLRQYLGEISPIKLKRFKRTVAVFVGPTGVGKTTTVAKLAAIHAINHHARVGLITTDTYRIAAAEQLKTYAEILELPVYVVYTPEELTEALAAFEDKDIVLIDTAGKSPGDPSHESEVSALIRGCGADEVHLVMSACTSFAGMLNIVNTYGFLTDYKLLFTKLDETPTWGGLLNMRFLADRPFSYTAHGQNVPDDIEAADTRKILLRLMGKEPL